MIFRDLLLDTLRTLWANKLRTFLTMFGIAWGIISITLMVAAGEGLHVGQKRVSDNFGKDIMIVMAGRTSMQAGGMRAGRLVRWSATDHLMVEKEAPSCGWIIPELGANLMVRSSYNSGNLRVTASLPPFAEIRTLPVGEGRFYTWEDDAQGRRVAFVGSDAHKQLFANREAVGQIVYIGEFPYTVIGVMRHKDQDSSYDGQDVTKLFIPFGAMLRDFPAKPPSKPFHIDRLLVTPKDVENHEACKLEVRRALGRMHGFDPQDEVAAGIWDTAEDAKAFRQMTDGMKCFLGAIGLVSLFLGGIGVMNVMLVAVRERTREIGVRKAVGATRREILSQFFIETAIVVFLSGGVGMGFAHGLCALVNRLEMPQFFAGLLATWETGVISFALLGAVAMLSALYPAGKAASVDPVVALRHEAGS